jgi:hypothetical protein
VETFILIMTYSVLVLAGLSLFGGALVALSTWLIDNSGDQNAH